MLLFVVLSMFSHISLLSTLQHTHSHHATIVPVLEKILRGVKVAKSKWGPTSIMTREIHPLGSNPFLTGSGCPTIRVSVLVRNDTGAFRVIHTKSWTSKTPFQGEVMLNFRHGIYSRLGHMERFSLDLIHFCALPWILWCLVIRHAFSILSSSCITCIHIRHERHSYWDSLC